MALKSDQEVIEILLDEYGSGMLAYRIAHVYHAKSESEKDPGKLYQLTKLRDQWRKFSEELDVKE